MSFWCTETWYCIPVCLNWTPLILRCSTPLTTDYNLGLSKARMRKGVQTAYRYETGNFMYTCLRKSSEISLVYLFLLTVCTWLDTIQFLLLKKFICGLRFLIKFIFSWCLWRHTAVQVTRWVVVAICNRKSWITKHSAAIDLLAR